MISHLLTTKNTKESKKHCRKSHFTKERLRSLVSSYHLHIFVFSAYFVVDFFYVAYNNKIYLC